MSKTSRPFVLLFTLLVSSGTLVLGCGGSEHATSDAGVCAAASDCDDRLFCTGEEACSPRSADADARGCVRGPAPCAGAHQSCSEAIEGCITECDPTAMDEDSDGYDSVACGGADCDDTDANRFPGNVEHCDVNGHDEDCDEETLGDLDNDRDGFVDARCCNARTAGGSHCGEDCDDSKRSVHPTSSEVCDGLDNNCDGQVDDGVAVPGFDDADFDTRGLRTAPRMGCPGTRGFSVYGGDCDDTNPAVNDLQSEVCDSVDNDCDTRTDEGALAAPWYVDADDDAYGLIDLFPVLQCTPPSPQHSLYTLDCDDTRASVGPLAPETCNALDDNCNGRADFVVAPGDYEDDDGDGHPDMACGGDDCDDRDFTTFPSAGDWIDGRDNDCDGEVDEGVDIVFYRDADNDGFGDVATTRVATRTPVGYVAVAGDCADDDAMRAPSASEVCDGGDNDCDTKTDEGLLVVFCPDGDGDGFGGPSAGCSMACPDAPPADTGVGALDCADGDQDVYPNAPEICDTVDNDCDGMADCPFCGDSMCNLSLGETPIACNADCASVCPDTYCSQGESTGSCASDCLCDVNERVAANRCLACTGGTTNEAGDDASGADTSCSDACQVALGVSCAVFAEAYVKAPSPAVSDSFGRAVALDGDTLVVGAPWEDSQAGGAQGNASSFNSGTVYVFVRNGSAWSQQALLKSVTIASVTEFGGAVAISGDTLAVGGSTGRVEVFTRSGSSWSRQAQLVGQFSEAVDTFGSSLALEGDTLVIGAEREGSAAAGVDGDQTNNDAPTSGAAYVFVRNDITWTQQAYLKATNPGSGDNFGSAVAISGDTVVVGAPLEDSDGMGVGTNGLNDNTMTSGAAYVFVRTAGVWSPQALLKASNTGASDRFGSSVAISGETLVVGAQGESSGASGVGGDQLNDSATGSGAAYVFVRVTNAWSQQAYIKASNTGMSDAFGGTVTLSGDVLVVAASAEDSNARNVNGLESDNSAEAGGAVYLFRRTGSVWAQVAYIKASNTGGGDYFGSSLALSGNTLVVGAFLEDGGFGGVNGNQSDNSRGGAGAAYVRRLAP